MNLRSSSSWAEENDSYIVHAVSTAGQQSEYLVADPVEGIGHEATSVGFEDEGQDRVRVSQALNQ